MTHTLFKRDFSRVAASGLFLLALAGCGQMATSPSHSHEHDHGDHATAASLVLNAGKKWAIDAPLREGMQRIQLLAAPLRAGQSLTPEQARAVATGVHGQIAYLIDNCKLEPQADAVLHVLIGDLMAGADALASAPSSARGGDLIRHALARYPRYFEHPGWSAGATGTP